MKNTFITALAVLLIAVVGCSKKADEKKSDAPTSGGDSASTSGTTSETPVVFAAPVVTPATAPVLGEVIPEVTGPDTDGAMFNLSDYRGKVVMIDFWGDW